MLNDIEEGRKENAWSFNGGVLTFSLTMKMLWRRNENEWFIMTWVDIYIKWQVQAFKAHVQLTETSITLKRSWIRQNLQHKTSFSHWNASNHVKTSKLNFSQILAKLVKMTKMPLNSNAPKFAPNVELNISMHKN